MRYPFLWERIAPDSVDRADWKWADERMERLGRNAIEPIAGLVHHGSGPRNTDLLDPLFPRKLAEYAGEFARRYPHIRYVTPINEPLTTARFSTLYGHWYPHRQSSPDFARALLNQCLATRSAMTAMREFIPELQLVQTEDLGRVYSTPRLEYQAAFENRRRWLTFDLLCGRVDDAHPMWGHLAVDRDAIATLQSLVEQPCPPDMIGANYYVTSDRFLDDRLHLHDASQVGGNGTHRYADIEAVRVVRHGIAGHAAILEEAWRRYDIPVAITEVHLGCTREHQIRWLTSAWEGALAARSRGCDVKAVTAWALFGSYGWDSLVTHEPFKYECGAFDSRFAEDHETGLARAIRELATAGECHDPATQMRGWWEKETRLSVSPVSVGSQPIATSEPLLAPGHRPSGRRTVIITGAGGTLGRAFSRICADRGIDAVAVRRDELDISSAADVRRVLDTVKPWAVINAAGYVRVDDAECDRAACYRGNAIAVGVLAAECAHNGIPLMTFSSDLVFDGRKSSPYVESDRVSPLNAYGASKAAAEICALSGHPDSLVIRTSAFFGPWDSSNFLSVALSTLARGLPFQASKDAVVSPTYVPDLVNASLDLLVDRAGGIWHLANQGAVSWSDFAKEAAARAGFSADLIHEINENESGKPARRPLYSVLGSERGQLLPSLDDAIGRYFGEASLPTLSTVPTW
jgi:dTDP-4-dehydrorhamnose reductase